MEVKNKKKEWVFKITNRDKIYWSIITVLLATIVVLAIVLPRPYRLTEADKQFVVDRNVYSGSYNIISKDNPLYDEGESSVQLGDKEYTILEKCAIVDAGTLKSARFKVNITGTNTNITIEQAIDSELVNEFIKNNNKAAFGVDLIVSSENIKSLTEAWKGSDEDAYTYRTLHYDNMTYILMFEFQKAITQIMVDYVE